MSTTKLRAKSQAKLPIRDIERYTGVSGLTETKYDRKVWNIVNGLRVVISMIGVPTGSVAVSGVTIGLLSGVFMAVTLMAPVMGAFYVFVGLGMPVAEAKVKVRQEAIQHGLAVGYVIAILNSGRSMAYDFFSGTHGANGGPRYMSGVYQYAYNLGLCLGYSAGIRLTESEKEKYRNLATHALIQEAKKDGRKLTMESWSDKRWVNEYVAVFV